MMAWHFPHVRALESTIRVGNIKLVRDYDHVNNLTTPNLELFRLYDSTCDKTQRVAIEESKNLAESMPKQTAKLNARLSVVLTEVKAATRKAF